MKNKIRNIILAGALGLFVLAAVMATRPEAVSGMAAILPVIKMSLGSRYKDIYKEEDRSQLIKFSHQYHMTEVGAECTQCHVDIMKSEISSDNNLTKMAACYTCHDQKTTECSKCHVEKAQPYSAFANPKRELVFNHKKHAGDLKVKCETCHTNLAAKTTAIPSALPVMESCMSCHNGSQANNNCTTCHTDVRFIRPSDHIAGFIRTHRNNVAAMGTTNCMFCHTEESCQECHEGSNMRKLKDHNVFVAGKGPKTAASDQGLNLETAHALDYIYTHQFDAKAKTSDCQACHETQSFCAKCHDESGSKVKPAWHNVAGFQTPKGTGGGWHAILAHKDMESCASCHDVTGREPKCLECHNPNGSAK